MDAGTARTVNMRQRVADAGGPAEWSRLYGGSRWTQPQVSQWISEANPKGIGHRLARALEDAMGMAPGDLDRPPSQSAGLDPGRLALAHRLLRHAYADAKREPYDVESDPELLIAVHNRLATIGTDPVAIASLGRSLVGGMDEQRAERLGGPDQMPRRKRAAG